MMQTKWQYTGLPLPDEKLGKFMQKWEYFPPFKSVRQLIADLNRENRRILEIQQQKRDDLRNMKIQMLREGRG
jgi:hypothetical protein